MKNKAVYNHVQKISLDDGVTWTCTHDWDFIYYGEKKDTVTINVDSFEMAQHLIDKSLIYNASNTTTFLFHKPQIRLFQHILYGDIYITEKQFKPFIVTNESIKEDNLTLYNLFKILPANQMIDFLKDNGLNICSVMK